MLRAMVADATRRRSARGPPAARLRRRVRLPWLTELGDLMGLDEAAGVPVVSACRPARALRRQRTRARLKTAVVLVSCAAEHRDARQGRSSTVRFLQRLLAHPRGARGPSPRTGARLGQRAPAPPARVMPAPARARRGEQPRAWPVARPAPDRARHRRAELVRGDLDAVLRRRARRSAPGTRPARRRLCSASSGSGGPSSSAVTERGDRAGVGAVRVVGRPHTALSAQHQLAGEGGALRGCRRVDHRAEQAPAEEGARAPRRKRQRIDVRGGSSGVVVAAIAGNRLEERALPGRAGRPRPPRTLGQARSPPIAARVTRVSSPSGLAPGCVAPSTSM